MCRTDMFFLLCLRAQPKVLPKISQRWRIGNGVLDWRLYGNDIQSLTMDHSGYLIRLLAR